jgi:hypothetical protein
MPETGSFGHVIQHNRIRRFFLGEKERKSMSESLTPDEEEVFREFLRLDVEPNQIPPDLFPGFLKEMAGSLEMPLQRVRIATQGLIDKVKFDTSEEETQERLHKEREVLRQLLLQDPEIRNLLKNIVAEICAKKT